MLELYNIHVCKICKNIEIVCVSKHWPTKDEIDLFVSQGYLPAQFFFRKIERIVVCSDILSNWELIYNFERVDIDTFNIELNCEMSLLGWWI